VQDFDFAWYVVRVFSGSENAVVSQIKSNAETFGVSDHFLEFNVASVTLEKAVKGKVEKKEYQKVLYPGYVFVKMHMTDRSISAAKSVAKVLDFLGSAGKPKRLTDAEYNKMLSGISLASTSSAGVVDYKVGDVVKMNSGPFKGFFGTILSVDLSKKSLHVSISVFGRETKFDILMSEVSK